MRVLFVGNLIPRKGLHDLLAALAHVEGAWELTVAGQKGPSNGYTKEIDALVRRLGIGANVRFMGRVEDEALVELYRCHHLFAAPSYEGFGIAYLEAQRYGLPVIALTTGAAREVVFDGQTGVLIPPGDGAALTGALTRFCGDRELLAALGMAARLRYTLHPTWAESMAGAVQWLTTQQHRYGAFTSSTAKTAG